VLLAEHSFLKIGSMALGKYTKHIQTYLRGTTLKDFKLEVAAGILGISESEVARELIKKGIEKVKDERAPKK